jgi:hypothetical protein
MTLKRNYILPVDRHLTFRHFFGINTTDSLASPRFSFHIAPVAGAAAFPADEDHEVVSASHAGNGNP